MARRLTRDRVVKCVFAGVLTNVRRARTCSCDGAAPRGPTSAPPEMPRGRSPLMRRSPDIVRSEELARPRTGARSGVEASAMCSICCSRPKPAERGQGVGSNFTGWQADVTVARQGRALYCPTSSHHPTTVHQPCGSVGPGPEADGATERSKLGPPQPPPSQRAVRREIMWR